MSPPADFQDAPATQSPSAAPPATEAQPAAAQRAPAAPPPAATAGFVERNLCINCGGLRLNELSSGRFDEGAVQRFMAEDPWGEDPAPFLRGHRWTFVGCQDCGQMFHRHILNPLWNERRFARWMSQEAIEAFERGYKTPEYVFRQAAGHTAHVLRLKQLTQHISGNTPPRVLDFGCGYGGFLSMCAAYGFDAVGVDRSAAKREHGSYAKVYPEIDDVRSRAPFQVLTLFEVLEHLDDPRQLMLQLTDLLQPGGILVLETPDCSGVRDIQTREQYHLIHPLEHINAFTPQTLKGFAQRLGFEPIARPVTSVAGGWKGMLKDLAKGVLAPVRAQTTQQYFRKG